MKNIEVILNSKEDYVSKYNNKRISTKLSEYILEECRGIDIKENIKILITPNFEMSENEKRELVDMLRENYGSSISDIEILSKKLLFLNFIMIIVGIIFLIFYFLSSTIPIFSEFILIIGWILIWEGVYNIIFQSIKNKIKIERNKKLTNCKIIFETK